MSELTPRDEKLGEVLADGAVGVQREHVEVVRRASLSLAALSRGPR